MSETVIKSCKCQHVYQDKKYGKGKRVMNAKANAQRAQQKYSCTVCGAEK